MAIPIGTRPSRSTPTSPRCANDSFNWIWSIYIVCASQVQWHSCDKSEAQWPGRQLCPAWQSGQCHTRASQLSIETPNCQNPVLELTIEPPDAQQTWHVNEHDWQLLLLLTSSYYYQVAVVIINDRWLWHLCQVEAGARHRHLPRQTNLFSHSRWKFFSQKFYFWSLI